MENVLNAAPLKMLKVYTFNFNRFWCAQLYLFGKNQNKVTVCVKGILFDYTMPLINAQLTVYLLLYNMQIYLIVGFNWHVGWLLRVLEIWHLYGRDWWQLFAAKSHNRKIDVIFIKHMEYN